MFLLKKEYNSYLTLTNAKNLQRLFLALNGMVIAGPVGILITN